MVHVNTCAAAIAVYLCQFLFNFIFASVMAQATGIPDGFGARLREERERLGLSQEALASLSGVKRLAQSQYEKEASFPTVRYLAALATAGVDLDLVIFGRRLELSLLSSAERDRIESEAFKRLEDFVQQRPEGRYGPEARHALFQMLRANLTQELVGAKTPVRCGARPVKNC
jgi:transcriptional regulator with XRE-family HTH domain